LAPTPNVKAKLNILSKKPKHLNTDDNNMLSIDNIMLSRTKMETKLKLLEKLEENPKGLHLREISRLLNTGLPNVVRYQRILENEKVIKKFKDANLVKLKLNPNQRTLAYLKQIHTERFLNLPKKIQLAIIDFNNSLIEQHITPLLTLIFGSYAKGNYTKNSDIDILLVFQGKPNPKIDQIAKQVNMKMNVKITPIYVKYKDFEKNFLDKNHDFSKEIRKKVIIFTGLDYYYKLLWRFLE